MLYILWSNKNNVGIPIIDEQHRGIVTTINSFYYFIQEGQGLNALKPTLNILEQYTFIHFKTEETLIKESGFPDIENHLMLHSELMKRTKTIASEALSLQDPHLALSFLKEWWLNHINREDKKYSPYAKKYLGIP